MSKVVVVGDQAVGKTSMIKRYVNDDPPGHYEPTVFDNFIAHVRIDGKTYHLGVWDPSGGDWYDQLRPRTYQVTDLFFLCFSLGSPASFKNVKKKWFPEIQRYSPGTPFILVGTKSDLRHDQEYLTKLAQENLRPVTKTEGKSLARALGAAGYLECSAKTSKGIEAVFDQATRIANKLKLKRWKEKKKNKKGCSCTLL